MSICDLCSVNCVFDYVVYLCPIAVDEGMGSADKTLGSLSVEMRNIVIRRIHIQTKALPIVLGSGCTFAGQP